MANTGTVHGDFQTKTVTIDTDLSSKEKHAVTFDASDDNVVNILAAATSVPFILVEGGDGSSTSVEGTIAVSGRYEVKLGGTVAAGDKLTATTGGEWITTTTDTNNYGAIAEVAGVDGDIIPVLIQQGMIAG